MILRRGKVTNISRSIRKYIAEDTGINDTDIPLYIIDEIVHNIVDVYSSILSTKDELNKSTAELIIKLCNFICEKRTEEKEEKD